MAAHLQHEDWDGQGQSDPEAARHVGGSGFGPASAVTSSGSGAMPQMGNSPGPTCRTSRCIGQV